MVQLLTSITVTVNNNNRAKLGQYGNQVLWNFDGEIDEVRLWEDDRTETEVRQYMCQKLDGTESDLKAYYTCDVNTNKHPY